MNDASKLQAIYDTEQHWTIRVEWDAGFKVTVNDSDYCDPKDLKVGYFDNAAAALEWLAINTGAKPQYSATLAKE